MEEKKTRAQRNNERKQRRMREENEKREGREGEGGVGKEGRGGKRRKEGSSSRGPARLGVPSTLSLSAAAKRCERVHE